MATAATLMHGARSLHDLSKLILPFSLALLQAVFPVNIRRFKWLEVPVSILRPPSSSFATESMCSDMNIMPYTSGAATTCAHLFTVQLLDFSSNSKTVSEAWNISPCSHVLRFSIHIVLYIVYMI